MRQARSFLFSVCSATALFWGAAAGAQNDGQVVLGLEEVASGFVNPLLVTHAGDGSGRLFVVQQRGRIRIITPQGNVLPQDFMDMSATGLARVSTSGSEQGLLGLAFHPDYANNGRFFVSYTLRSADLNVNGDSIIAEYRVSEDPNVALVEEKIILGPLDQPFANHNGGHILFGPDGYLYIGLGDGGSGGDPEENGQDKNTLLGSILRIDVDSGDPYAIPPDNPFLGEIDGLDEIYAYGLRNPWRFSFDPETNRLFCGDVGQNLWEEVSIVEKGDNMGWNLMEGFHCFPPQVTDCQDPELKLPITEYGRDLGVSVTGGFVYRGMDFPDMQGLYFFADHGSARIWRLEEISPDEWERTEVLPTNPLMRISSFGEDEERELYLCDYARGRIFRLVDLVPSPTPTITETPTVTPTPTVTETPTITSTPSLTLTHTPTLTHSATPTVTDTATITHTPSFTTKFTPTETATETVNPSETSTETGTPTLTATPGVDLNGDSNVNGLDLMELLKQAAGAPPSSGQGAADLDGDEDVDGDDLFIFSGDWSR